MERRTKFVCFHFLNRGNREILSQSRVKLVKLRWHTPLQAAGHRLKIRNPAQGGRKNAAREN